MFTHEKVTSVDKLDHAISRDGDDERIKLGLRYTNGQGVQRDDKRGVALIELAANNGHPRAQCILGDLYANGNRVRKNRKIAVKWYRLAAEQGFDPAQVELGKLYCSGKGVRRDAQQAINLFHKAAVQGNTEAAKLFSETRAHVRDGLHGDGSLRFKQKSLVLLIVFAILSCSIYAMLYFYGVMFPLTTHSPRGIICIILLPPAIVMLILLNSRELFDSVAATLLGIKRFFRE